MDNKEKKEIIAYLNRQIGKAHFHCKNNNTHLWELACTRMDGADAILSALGYYTFWNEEKQTHELRNLNDI